LLSQLTGRIPQYFTGRFPAPNPPQQPDSSRSNTAPPTHQRPSSSPSDSHSHAQVAFDDKK